MRQIILITELTLISARRDKAFLAIVAVGVMYFVLAIPAASALSLRQVREVATSMSLSGISFCSVILAVVFGLNTLYRDIERKFIYHALSLPVSREQYILGRFSGLAAALAGAVCIMMACSYVGIAIAIEMGTSDRPMLWTSYFLAVYAEYLKVLILLGFTFLFSVFSTTVFVPLFATISVYLAGSVTQPVVEYLKGGYGTSQTPLAVSALAQFAYYALPNFSAFDLKFRAIYGLPVALGDIAIITAYALLYLCGVLVLTLTIFRKRDLA